MKLEKEEKVRVEQQEQARKEKAEKLKKENEEKVRREKEEQIRREKEELIRREKEDELRRLAVMKADEEARLLVSTQDYSRRFLVTHPFLKLCMKYSLLMYFRELKKIGIAEMPRTRKMNDKGCLVKPLERLGVQAGTQVGISATNTLYRPFLTPLIYSLLLTDADMNVDEDVDEDEDQGGEDISPSKKGSTSYMEQKRRAAQWAADNLKGLSGKKEKAKVRSRCLCLYVSYSYLPYFAFAIPLYLTLPCHILPCLTSLLLPSINFAMPHLRLPCCCPSLLSSACFNY